MRKFITMLAILVAGIVSAQTFNFRCPVTFTNALGQDYIITPSIIGDYTSGPYIFNEEDGSWTIMKNSADVDGEFESLEAAVEFIFNFEEAANYNPPSTTSSITLSQDLEDAGWVINFTNGAGGELTNTAYPGYVIFNTSDDEELDPLTFSDPWEATLNGDDLSFDNDPIYLGQIIAYIVDDFNDNNVLGAIINTYINFSLPELQLTLTQQQDILRLDLFQRAIEAWSDSDTHNVVYGIEIEEENAFITLTDNDDITKHATVRFQYNISVDFENAVLVLDLSVSTLANEENYTGLDLSAGIPGTDIESIITYLEAVREIISPIPDEVEEEEEVEAIPALVEIRTIVTTTILPGRDPLYYITKYMFVDGFKGDAVPESTELINIEINSDTSRAFGSAALDLLDDGWYVFDEDAGIDEGPFETLLEAIQTVINLTGGIVVVEQPPIFVNVTSAEVLSNSSIEIMVGIFYYEDGVVGDQFGETGSVIIPPTLRGFGTWTDGNLTLTYVQTEGTYGISDSSTGLNRTGLTLEQMVQIYINLS